MFVEMKCSFVAIKNVHTYQNKCSCNLENAFVFENIFHYFSKRCSCFKNNVRIYKNDMFMNIFFILLYVKIVHVSFKMFSHFLIVHVSQNKPLCQIQRKLKALFDEVKAAQANNA